MLARLCIGEAREPLVRLGRDFALDGELAERLAQIEGLANVSLTTAAVRRTCGWSPEAIDGRQSMFAFLKAVALGSSWRSSFRCSSARAGRRAACSTSAGAIEGYQFYWSWALFLIGTGLSFGIFLMMD